jgi:GT2 family glycosyltransferase
LQGDETLPSVDPADPLSAWRIKDVPLLEEEPRKGADPARGTGPRCSIVIPVWNRIDLTRQCLDHLFRETTGESYEVIVIDNGSTDGTAEFLRSNEPKIRLISNPRNLGFASACNQGARAAGGEYVVFLNNDTVPLPGWLAAMVAVADAESDVGVVGSKLLFPDNSIQHAGVALFRGNRAPYHVYSGAPGDAPIVSHRRDLKAVTGACMLLRRDFFLELGGFDEGYRNGFEDIDLCFRVTERGSRVVYEPASVLYHLESQTPGRLDNHFPNFQRFLARWGDPWWIDEEGIYAEDGLVMPVMEERRRGAKEIRRFQDADEQIRWQRVAEVQRRAAREGVAAVRDLLERPADWPQDPDILAWGESLCLRGGLSELAPGFRARLTHPHQTT